MLIKQLSRMSFYSTFYLADFIRINFQLYWSSHGTETQKPY